MAGMGEVAAASGLFEREGELEELRGLIERAVVGTGGVLLVEGPPGIGKTELLRAGRDLAREAGATVLQARGSELERDFAFGVARQLFQAPLAGLAENERRQALSGAGALAGSLLDVGDDGDEASEGEIFPKLHGLHWLCANLSLTQPLVLLVDDAHWADEPSLRFLQYLAGRIEELPVLAIVATRSTKPEAPVPLLEAVREERASVALEPAPLGEVGTRLLLTNAFEAAADDDFARACREASGGNPFLLTELARSLSAEGARPTAGAEQSVDAISPAAVSRSVLTRLARMPADAQQLALAVAVLGDGAAIEDAAALAGVDDAAALEAAEVLAAGAIFEARQPLGFSHPLIRSALYDDISPARREREHRRSAELLIAREAAPEKIASHLLLCPPAGAVDAAAALQRAGEEAMSRGAPRIALAYFERALAERSGVGSRELFELLAFAAYNARDRRSRDWGLQAIGAAEGIVEQARTMASVAPVISFQGLDEIDLESQNMGEAVFLGLIAGVRNEEPDLALRLEADMLAAAGFMTRSMGPWTSSVPTCFRVICRGRPSASASCWRR